MDKEALAKSSGTTESLRPESFRDPGECTEPLCWIAGLLKLIIFEQLFFYYDAVFTSNVRNPEKAILHNS